MITITQGESITLCLTGSDYRQFKVDAILYPAKRKRFSRDCNICSTPAISNDYTLSWDNLPATKVTKPDGTTEYIVCWEITAQV